MSNKTDLTITITPTSRRLSDLASTSSSPFAKKERVRCMFCGGDQCSKCGIHAHQKLEKPGIPNLHSHWINESILAMQRPSDILLEEYGVLESFKKANITAVFNLTEPGEHPYCGPGVLPHSGFPYTPEKLMKAGSKPPLRVHLPLPSPAHSWHCIVQHSQTLQFQLAGHDRAHGGDDDGDRLHRRGRAQPRRKGELRRMECAITRRLDCSVGSLY